jgi:hypothetical protein
VEEFASARCNVVSPVTFILCAIRPDLDTEAVSLVSANSQLTFVDGTIREYDFFSKLETLLVQ